jgi:hypothetical protein
MLASFAGVNGWGIPSIQRYATSADPWADHSKKYWGIVHNVASLVIAIGLGLIFGVFGAFGRIGAVLTLGLLILVRRKHRASKSYSNC